MTKPRILILMGSDSDLAIMAPATEVLEKMSVPYRLHIASAHRTPDYVDQIIAEAEKEEMSVIIAAAGMAAHLAGVVAAKTLIPVIGVPLGEGKHFDGMDALLAMVQMPAGFPVATVAMDGAQNGALLALQMMAISDRPLKEKLKAYRAELSQTVRNRDKKLQELGVKGYLDQKKAQSR